MYSFFLHFEENKNERKLLLNFDHNNWKQIVKQVDSLQIDGQGGWQVGRYRRYWQVDIYEDRQLVGYLGRQLGRQICRYTVNMYIVMKIGSQLDTQVDSQVDIY